VNLWSIDLGSKQAWKPLLIPGAALLFASVVLLQSGIVPISGSAVDLYYFGVFGAGILLAWRFHSSRVLFALLSLLLAHRALTFFSGGRISLSGPGRIAFEATAFLLPINFVIFSFSRDRGLVSSGIASHLGLLFFQSVFVAVICRPGEIFAPSLLHWSLFSARTFQWTGVPQIAWLMFISASTFLCVRFLIYRKPVESGLLWSLVAVFAGLQAGGVGGRATAYIATGGLILAGSIIENSYVLAYHDDLTSLPARRAFNDALLRLEPPYTLATVDIDHFKAFNDNYGHETGDQVLRMVAANLARVGGGGIAFRVGGEEFSILFPGEDMHEALPHLERLRFEIENSTFRLRSLQGRRQVTQHTVDRRKPARRKSSRGRHTPARSFSHELSVTVSIGVAEPAARWREVEAVIRAADKALYRAKHSGRNRVETAPSDRASAKRSIA
jgi:diguanylate cyclase (GGDEF)-like protein